MLDFDDSVYEDAVSGEGLRKHCNKSYKPTSYDLSFDTGIEANDVWFVKRDFLSEFFGAIPPSSPPVSVVTQHSDYELDDAVMSTKPLCVNTVFGSNATSTRPDVVPVPLGLGPSYCSITPKAEDIARAETKRKRTKLLYVNFRVSTYPRERQPALHQLCSLSDAFDGITIAEYQPNPKTWSGYLNDLVDHKFCACPRGNGIDTHRLWEALYCRTIPVVRYEPAYRNFRDLPILFVDSWESLTTDYLNTQYESITNQEWNYSKMKASWWSTQFRHTMIS
jgi:hypothetical protein